MKSKENLDLSLVLTDSGGDQIGDWNCRFPRIDVKMGDKVVGSFFDSFGGDVIIYDGFILVRTRRVKYPTTNGYWGPDSTIVAKESVYIIGKKPNKLAKAVPLEDFLKRVALK